MESNKIKLTQTVAKGGCAAKVAATELRAILKQVQFPPNDSAVLIDGGLFDDAAVYKINSELALVQTLDFFTPIVDTPYLFGQIATSNALSDVYAMGGEPRTALAILAFPLATLPQSAVVEVLQGACDLMKLAEVNFVGGHSIDDDTLKFGLSVTGYVHPEKIWSNQGAQTGDHLILTKPLGTGTCMAALKRGELSENELTEPLKSMCTINRCIDLFDAEELSAIHAATDITGFGLMGHASHIARGSQKTIRLNYSKIPLFPQTEHCLKNNFLTKAHRTNQDYVSKICLIDSLQDWQRLSLYDPQTSGGLLLSVDSSLSLTILEKLKNRFQDACIIGKVTNQEQNLIEVQTHE